MLLNTAQETIGTLKKYDLSDSITNNMVLTLTREPIMVKLVKDLSFCRKTKVPLKYLAM